MTPAKAWLLAARPKTLSAAAAPVVVAAALAKADGTFRPLPALFCVLFALTMQVAANFINDLFDFLKGTDGSDRLGPERACAQGWLTPRAMRRGIGVALAAAAVMGSMVVVCSVREGVVSLGTAVAWLGALGAACMVFAFLYTTLLSYVGLGDLLVYVFFGFVPVLGTYFVQAGRLTAEAWLLGAAIGVVTDTLLILNNYRDRDTDRQSGKRTLIALLGERFGSWFYVLHGIAATLLSCTAIALEACRVGEKPWGFLLLIYVVLHVATWRTMTRIGSGRELNRVLGLTSRNILLFSLLTAIALSV